jgi:hypothetical protein
MSRTWENYLRDACKSLGRGMALTQQRRINNIHYFPSRKEDIGMKPLSGWKEIATHLNQSVRTVQRWEELGLPVRRVKRPAGQVVAFIDEVEAWERSAPARYQNQIDALMADMKWLKAKVSALQSQLSDLNYQIRKPRSRGGSKAA